MRIRTWMGAYAQVLTAMTGGVRLLLVHEAPSWHQSTPNACPFDDFFTCDRGTTPILLLRAGIYRPIATQLRAQPLRTASLVALVQQIGTKDAHERTPNEMLRTRQLEVVRAMTQRISLREASRLGDDTEENSVAAVIETGISHMLGFMELGSMKLGSMKLGGAAPAQEQTPLRERERIVHSFHGHGTVISSVHAASSRCASTSPRGRNGTAAACITSCTALRVAAAHLCVQNLWIRLAEARLRNPWIRLAEARQLLGFPR